MLIKITLERVGTVVGSNSSHWLGSIGTQIRPRTEQSTVHKQSKDKGNIQL